MKTYYPGNFNGNDRRYNRNQNLLLQTPGRLAKGQQPPDTEGARLIIESVLTTQRKVLTEPESMAVLNAFGIPTVRNSMPVWTRCCPAMPWRTMTATDTRTPLKFLAERTSMMPVRIRLPEAGPCIRPIRVTPGTCRWRLMLMILVSAGPLLSRTGTGTRGLPKTGAFSSHPAVVTMLHGQRT